MASIQLNIKWNKRKHLKQWNRNNNRKFCQRACTVLTESFVLIISRNRKRRPENQKDGYSLKTIFKQQALVPQTCNATFWFILPSQWFVFILPSAKTFPKLVLCASSSTWSYGKILMLRSHWGAPSSCFHPQELACRGHISLLGWQRVPSVVSGEGEGRPRATVPSQDRPWEVTPERLSLHTLQKVGRAWEQAYQLCIPEKCSTLNWAT